nr:MAG TPA: hypothetical protein [Caudoviricetes sp.]DAL07124.1 MAG TPA: hypothetical protein [Caudoviricetes sp.]
MQISIKKSPTVQEHDEGRAAGITSTAATV